MSNWGRFLLDIFVHSGTLLQFIFFIIYNIHVFYTKSQKNTSCFQLVYFIFSFIFYLIFYSNLSFYLIFLIRFALHLSFFSFYIIYLFFLIVLYLFFYFSHFPYTFRLFLLGFDIFSPYRYYYKLLLVIFFHFLLLFCRPERGSGRRKNCGPAENAAGLPRYGQYYRGSAGIRQKVFRGKGGGRLRKKCMHKM